MLNFDTCPFPIIAKLCIHFSMQLVFNLEYEMNIFKYEINMDSGYWLNIQVVTNANNLP